MAAATRDPSSLANYNHFRVSHTTANLSILFDSQQLAGNVVHSLLYLQPAAEIVLDSSYLNIKAVSVDGKTAHWTLAPRQEPFGSPLKITLPAAVEQGKSVEVDIALETTDKCSAIQFLTPAQTSTKKHPYMFSQCQAIHARSIFPCQDTPDVKATFDFNISSPLPVIASGVAVGQEKSADGLTTYKFHQKVPIPSYLFALASGDIVEAPIGPISKVATSPDQLKDCQWELEEATDKFIQAINKLIFPYVWGEYNVLVLPPSFPYGGMENPVYTFATPTLISKDRENVDVIAHELSHSWSGNLVTASSWEHFWLNEGWTTYLERRIMAAVHGEAHRHFSAIIGWKALVDSVERYGSDHDFTKLVTNLEGKDPDDAFSTVPYEKGFVFLFFLENLLGKDKFDAFIPHYFKTYMRKSLDSYEFRDCLKSFFAADQEASAKLEALNFDHWYFTPGLPPKPNYDTSLVDRVYALASKWRALSNCSSDEFTPHQSDVEGLNANQIVVFLEQVLLFDKPLTAAQSQQMGQAYGFSASQNYEVTARYYQVGLKSHDQAVIKPTQELLGCVGRMKHVRPLYRELAKFDKQIAIDTFKKNEDFYHPICKNLVEKDLFGSSASSS
ncbi:hypothetical protein KEM56_003448 [Ascosphaera pollenicola]|nr:hypothetical protein KEM56_003448 [Ascosphaera pollenicola]